MPVSGLNNLRELFFGSIRKKLYLSFGFLVLLMILLSLSTYYLNNESRMLTHEIRDISAPMDLMVEQVIGYDAMLTGSAHAAILFAEKGDFGEAMLRKEEYDKIGAKMDDLLKKNYVALLEQTSMSSEIKLKERNLLANLDRLNIDLVDLETKAFDAIERRDINSASSFIVGGDYQVLKNHLSADYRVLSITQKGFTDSLRQRALKLLVIMDLVNEVFAFLIVIAGLLVMFFASRSITIPVAELHRAVKEIGKGNFKVRAEIKTHDELRDVADTLNNTAVALSETEEKRKQIDKVKTEFLSITSHELRSPMTPMRAQLQMLLGNYFGKLNSKQREAAEIVLRNTERLDKILMDFLEISRIEAARLKFSFVKTSLSKNIERVVEEIKGFMPEKKVDIELRLPALPEFEVDPDRVMQVLRNLMNNAVKFVPNRGGKVIVTVQVKSDSLLFSVKDNGVGIADENKPRIFEPFFQEEQSMYRKYQGTGLGLAICRGIIESQKGKIWFESAKGRGTTFFFTVPFIPVKEIAPIKVLFSERALIDDKLKKILVDTLGPMAEPEFVELQKKGLSEKIVLDYADELSKIGIISDKEGFINKVRGLFSEKSESK